jgi:hypothetical protein
VIDNGGNRIRRGCVAKGHVEVVHPSQTLDRVKPGAAVACWTNHEELGMVRS